MKRMTPESFFNSNAYRVGLCSLSLMLVTPLVLPNAHAANSVSFEYGNSIIDTPTGNFTGLGQYYWFANFQNPNSLSPVTGAPMNQNEAKSLPSWLHLESNPACIGTADDCSTPDNTYRTGFSFLENTTPANPGPPPYPTIGATSTGGQAGFNAMTLPNGMSGISGLAVDTRSRAKPVRARTCCICMSYRELHSHCEFGW
jgi:hypothetical protein